VTLRTYTDLVLLPKDKDNKTVTLFDYEGVFLTVNPESEREHTDGVEEMRTRESSQSPEPSGTDELELTRNERDELQAAIQLP